jgi:hypothetical protein
MRDMASESNLPPSFSAGQRWRIFFSVLISVVAVTALVIMLNYLAARYYTRFTLSQQAQMELSPQTKSLLKSITNKVSVVIYYDKQNGLYDSVNSLLTEYHLTNPKISVQTVDYQVDAAAAQQVKATNHLSSSEDRNLVIFTSNGHSSIIPDSLLADYTYESVPNDKQPEYIKHLQAFEGEKWFSAAILSITSPKPRMAYFLEGHGEHSINDSGNNGYQKFAVVLEQNTIESAGLKLFGTNNIPTNCNLLIIAGPTRRIPQDELDKIKVYLNQGGRMLALFNPATKNFDVGLEPLLADWNIAVGLNEIHDPENTSGDLTMISSFNRNQSLVAPLIGSSLAMVRPRSIEMMSASKEGPEAPKVEDLAFTGTNATRSDSLAPPGHPIPVMAAAEKGSVKGVLQERGTTAMVVVGDSIFLENLVIDQVDANRDFAGFAVNWLLDQTELLQGVGPHPVKEYKLLMTNAQLTRVRWLFLGAMPGAILLFGGAVWFRRRR